MRRSSATRPPAVKTLDDLLRRLARRAADPRVRRWAERLRSGERATAKK